MQSTRLGAIAAATAAVMQFHAPLANAAVVTQCGPNICYEYDNAQAAAALYGQPSLAGDNAYFTPTVFEARSTDGVGLHAPFTNTDFVDGTWLFSRVWLLDPFNEISAIYAFEEGDYEVNYAGGEVHGDLYLQAFGLNAIEGAVIDTDSVDFYGASGGLQTWSMSAAISPAANLNQMANNISLTIQNQLSAFTSNSTAGPELAWIEKKLILQINTVIPTGATVPVPAAFWLFGSAFGLLALARRRQA